MVAGGWNILKEKIFEEWVTASQVYRKSAFQAEQAATQNICTWCVLDGGTEISHTCVFYPEGVRVSIGNSGSAEE